MRSLFVRRLTTDFLREFSDSLALDTADGQVFRIGSKLTLRSRDGRCAVRRAAARFRLDHPRGRIRHADDEHPEMDKRNHHRHAGCFLAAVRGGGGGEDAGRFPFHRAGKPEARSRVDERLHGRVHVAVARRRTEQQSISFAQVIQGAGLDVFLVLPDFRGVAVACFRVLFRRGEIPVRDGKQLRLQRRI